MPKLHVVFLHVYCNVIFTCGHVPAPQVLILQHSKENFKEVQHGIAHVIEAKLVSDDLPLAACWNFSVMSTQL